MNTSITKRGCYFGFFALITAAILFRLFFFIFGLQHLPISTDEAWPALMGLHVLKGEFPVFYWGQNYMGAFQAYFDALMYCLLGVNTLAARVYPFCFSLVYLAAVCLLARRIYGGGVALITLGLLIIPPPYLTMAGTLSVPPEYLALTALGGLALVLLAGIQGRDASPRHPTFQNRTARTQASPRATPRRGAVPTSFEIPIHQGRDASPRHPLIGRLGPSTSLRTGEPSLPSNRTDGPAVLPFLLLGLLLGFMFWLHIAAIGFIAAALVFIFLRDKLCFLRPAFWLMVAAFFIGGAPFWWFNIHHDFITFADMAGTVDWPTSFRLCKSLFGITILFMTGQKVMLYGDSRHYASLPAPLALALGLAICVLLALVILARWRGMVRWFMWKPRGADGTAILIALAVLVIYAFCRSERSSWDNARFILPVMAVLPVLLAAGLEQIGKWNRFVCAFFMIVIVGAQAWGNFILYREWSDPEVVGKKLELPDTRPPHVFLKERGITHAYAHYWISYRLTFESREKIICAEPFNERFPGRPAQYLDEVHAATNAAFITHPTLNFVPDFEEHLKMLGGTYQRQQAGDFTVYYDFTPPYGKTGLLEIKREGWRLSADQHPDLANLMMDGNPQTRWESGAPQKAGDQIAIDFGSVKKICKLRFDLSGVESDAPNGYRLEVSGDGNEWKKVYESGAVSGGFFWENGQPWIYVGNNYFSAAFAPVECRYIRMTLTEGHRRFWWSIGEARVFGPTSETGK